MTDRMRPDAHSDTSAGRIYQELHRAIIVGRIRPGTRFSLESLSEEHGTSITPVREALQMLGREGLVTVKPHSGFFVTQLTLKQLRDMLELRQVLEVASVERAAARITPAQIAELEQVHAGYTGDDDASCDRYMAENRTFHVMIAEASGNQELAEALGHLHDRLAPHLVLVHSGDAVESIHRLLIEALRSGDIARARQQILDEVNETREVILERLIQEEGDSWPIGVRPGEE
jgi:DNA-binding GntR family transcriptional regulator